MAFWRAVIPPDDSITSRHNGTAPVWTAIAALVVIGIVAVTLGIAYDPTASGPARSAFAARVPGPPSAAYALDAPASAIPPPAPSLAPTGRFTYAVTGGPVRGTGGRLRRYRLAVEAGLGFDVEQFGYEVDAILGDPRSWIAAGDLRLQRVPAGTPAEFTIYLASPATSHRMCRAGGVDTRRYTSCHAPGKVVLNVERWSTAVPGYGAPLAEYRRYAVNHEVGHQLGHGHERCPGRGRPAPVMQQQTFGLKGCVANGWPYIDGRRYSGPPTS